MSTDFDSFCESQFGGFIESMLGARGCVDAVDDCIAPHNMEGACSWEHSYRHGSPGAPWSDICVGCWNVTARECRRLQELWGEGNPPVSRFEWNPYWRCGVPGWEFPGVGQYTCDDYWVSRFWNSALLEQGWCRLGPLGALQGRTTRTLCNELGGEYHDPYPAAVGYLDWDPTLPCCVYSHEGTHCFNWSPNQCAAQGGVEHGAIGDTCAGVSCATRNFWGACCHSDGTCEEHVQPDDCHADAGAIWYACDACDAIACEEGACCLPTGVCQDGLTSPACGAVSGFYQGPGTTCDDPDIDCEDRITAACCLPDGTCREFTKRRNCIAADGMPTGLASCADVTCPDEMGACCRDFGTPEATCRMDVPLGCATFGGYYMGGWSRCSETQCWEGEGACCRENGLCHDWPGMTRPHCEHPDNDNLFIGFGTRCTPFLCDGPRGACCSRFGGPLCNVIPAAACDPNYGLYMGDGTTCESVLCPEKIGACCRADGGCHQTWRESCEQYGGTFQGATVSCADVDCGPDRVCCLPDGSCISTGLLDCRARGGAWNDTTGMDCSDSPWMCRSGSGACCVSERCYHETPYEECVEAGGRYYGAGSLCSWAARDCRSGACCLPDGTCEDELPWTKAWCDNRGGDWRGQYGDYITRCRENTGHPYDVDCSEPP